MTQVVHFKNLLCVGDDLKDEIVGRVPLGEAVGGVQLAGVLLDKRVQWYWIKDKFLGV